MVLIYKGRGKLCAISLVEVAGMVAAVIINCPFTNSIAFHDILHGLRAGCGTATDSLETKLIQQLMSMREEFMYTIFMDLYNVYDALDRDICLDILDGYGKGPQACLILCSYWDRLRMVDLAGG